MSIKFNNELILLELDAKTNIEAIEKVATHLFNKGLVKSSYIKAIQEREKIFSTGLPSKGYGVAIPHTDSEHINEQAICIGILKESVKFKVMGCIDETVDVNVLFMLAINEPNIQIKMLQIIVGIAQKSELLSKICNSKDIQLINNLIQKELNKIYLGGAL